jgi:hypothetical protein
MSPAVRRFMDILKQITSSGQAEAPRSAARADPKVRAIKTRMAPTGDDGTRA